MSELQFRQGRDSDLSAINVLYNHFVANSVALFETKAWDMHRREQWFDSFTQRPELYQLWVAYEGPKLVGFAYNGAFKAKPAYDSSSEITVYVDPEYHGQRIAKQLYLKLFEGINKSEIHRVYALVVTPNAASERLHEVFGFHRAGLLHQSGFKFGAFHDVIIYEKRMV
ncbi:N-acetyltransferase [Alginatibacterium sediminis]|uniref:N-acetyltransferase n=1 Tax=Alginatibacterium sediminis TaxID=2164068 RepID=A0A420E945_9ALTE|nr:GNAT family N-acetyltransferase [Alginatibacterium sediminis]RKF15612.1 N-acetyltransferase [Alginatibacterium sediminis]